MSEPNTGLRSRLVDVGVELVTAEGVQALSLREIARRAGVSHGAPRRYFPTHLELLSAIARRGFEELAAQGAAAVGEGTASPREQIATLGRVYLDFALTHRGMHELMFRHDLLESNRLGLRDASLPVFSLLVDLVGRVRPDADARLVAGALLANLYGIAQLWTWGSLKLITGAADFVPLLNAALEAHLGSEER
ncbi:TetR/AcrR family transcriptional regulator [Streptomyces europaeiscabiei]|uniref:TetR/AcrR family transcriptional regulator n=1 Tax=Streptomyces europaeiscabiei TaxID=146819 RepID=UPI0006282FCB|nr:TetR/AcrR family transcriptional regulator [Streptomyces europaeiscabiei]MDX2527090.1 TetR/AcrR family transcriptional regulator [Streptomyces europaeiscabiei]MDX2775362.1 TetR/AcrR family transcriptional regulator [Streptomyces europaeiscabiei]MDX3707439.1 TetR/AcrR family transcriptional regulator [Streptomyces europaeiscabiei]MDX3842468.1 TetR/AcrR family transcriptional regulator [Streptomyces europaeiscabiei]MDX3860201.1 TetR/AcrR family transcriptional regulator [Streptomyces europaei